MSGLKDVNHWIRAGSLFVLFCWAANGQLAKEDAGTIYGEATKLSWGNGCRVDEKKADELYKKSVEMRDLRALA